MRHVLNSAFHHLDACIVTVMLQGPHQAFQDTSTLTQSSAKPFGAPEPKATNTCSVLSTYCY